MLVVHHHLDPRDRGHRGIEEDDEHGEVLPFDGVEDIDEMEHRVVVPLPCDGLDTLQDILKV